MTELKRAVRGFAIVRWLATGALAAGVIATAAAQAPGPAAPAAKAVAPVAVAQLEALLPAVKDWTKGPVKSNHIEMSDDCSYASSEAMYSNGEMRVRITIADSGFHPDSLMALATMTSTLPEGYSGKIPPATTVERVTLQGFPGAARWDGEKNEGQFEIVVGKRFVAKGEGTHVDAMDSIRALVQQVDLTKLGALK